jgi:hypothetical protein
LDENRRYLRLKDNFRISFALVPAPAPGGGGAAPALEDSPVGYSKDLSVGGLCLVTDEDLGAGEVVSAELHAPELEGTLEFQAEVVRARLLESGQREIALRFLPSSLDERARQRLENLVYAELRDPEDSV